MRCIDKIVNNSQRCLDKMLAIVVLAYAACLIVGEADCVMQYAYVDLDELDLLEVPQMNKRSRWILFSVPFLLLKQCSRPNHRILQQLVNAALLLFDRVVFADIRPLVHT